MTLATTYIAAISIALVIIFLLTLNFKFIDNRNVQIVEEENDTVEPDNARISEKIQPFIKVHTVLSDIGNEVDNRVTEKSQLIVEFKARNQFYFD